MVPPAQRGRRCTGTNVHDFSLYQLFFLFGSNDHGYFPALLDRHESKQATGKYFVVRLVGSNSEQLRHNTVTVTKPTRDKGSRQEQQRRQQQQQQQTTKTNNDDR